MVIVEGLLPDDDVPAAREGAQHVGFRPRLGEPELDPVRVQHHDVADGGEERRARDDHALGRMRDAVVGGLDVVGGEVGSVVEFHALPEMEGVALPVRRDVVLPGQVRDDGLPILRAAAEQGVVHRALGPDIGHRARLMDVEVGGRIVHGVAKGAAPLGRRVGPDGRGRLLRLRPPAQHGGAEGGGAADHSRGAEEGATADGFLRAAGVFRVGHGAPSSGLSPRFRAQGGGTIHEGPEGYKSAGSGRFLATPDRG